MRREQKQSFACRHASDFFDLLFAEQAGGLEEQDQNQDRERDAVAVGRQAGDAAGEGLHDAEDESAERRARQIADAAEHRRDEGLQAGLHAHQRLDAGVVHGVTECRPPPPAPSRGRR